MHASCSQILINCTSSYTNEQVQQYTNSGEQLCKVNCVTASLHVDAFAASLQSLQDPLERQCLLHGTAKLPDSKQQSWAENTEVWKRAI